MERSPGRPWLWHGLLVELFKPVVGLTHGTAYFMQCVDSAAHGIYGDLVAHYNYLRGQERFASEVAYSLEQLPEF